MLNNIEQVAQGTSPGMWRGDLFEEGGKSSSLFGFGVIEFHVVFS